MMLIRNHLHFVSIEGNWDKEIHDERIAQAVEVLNENKAALVIASGTHAPHPHVSFFHDRLGEYTKEVLINNYEIPAMRVIPAYLFPYTSTYTIIDAFTNAVLIGWLACGLKRRRERMNVFFEPTTSAFHALRVEMLNLRACKYLNEFNVQLEISCKNKLTDEQLESEYQEELVRLSEMQSKDGLMMTGEWLDHEKKRSYDDLCGMKHDLAEAFKSVFKCSLLDIYQLSDLERLIFTLSWNQLANSKGLIDENFEDIYRYVESYFDVKVPDAIRLKMKSVMNEIKIE